MSDPGETAVHDLNLVVEVARRLGETFDLDSLLKQKMGESLEEIRSGAFAKEWSSDRAGKLEPLLRDQN